MGCYSIGDEAGSMNCAPQKIFCGGFHFSKLNFFADSQGFCAKFGRNLTTCDAGHGILVCTVQKVCVKYFLVAARYGNGNRKAMGL